VPNSAPAHHCFLAFDRWDSRRPRTTVRLLRHPARLRMAEYANWLFHGIHEIRIVVRSAGRSGRGWDRVARSAGSRWRGALRAVHPASEGSSSRHGAGCQRQHAEHAQLRPLTSPSTGWCALRRGARLAGPSEDSTPQAGEAAREVGRCTSRGNTPHSRAFS